MVTGVETPRSDPIRRSGSRGCRGMRRIDCHGFCLHVSGGVCCFPMMGIFVLRLTYGVTWLLRAVRRGGSEWDRWCWRGPCADRTGSDLAAFRCRVKPRSRVREEASVDGASRLAPPPEWSKNSFFRESAEVLRRPAGGEGHKHLTEPGTRKAENLLARASYCV